MTKRDWFLLISTFLIGLFCGMYLYFTTFVPEYIENPALEAIIDERASTLQIVGTQYGGCQMTGQCASYEVRSDRSYRYAPWTPRGDVPTIEVGTVPRALFREVENVLLRSDLNAAAQPAEKNCVHFADGIDYEYKVTLQGDFYELDTCFTALNARGATAEALRALFDFMEDPTVEPAGLDINIDVDGDIILPSTNRRQGLGGYLEGILEDTFDGE